MSMFKRGNCLLMTAYALSAGFTAAAQSPADLKAVPAYRSAVINAVIDKVQKKHYQPRAIDDAYAAAVWNRYLHTLDPNSYILLQEDVELLSKYRQQVDDQLLKGSPEFFEAAYDVYRRRATEAEADYKQLMATPFSFDRKETVKHIRKEEPFTASRAERKELWRKLLKYHVIRNYMDMAVAADSNALAKDLNKEMLAKAEAKVKKQYDEFFRYTQTQKSSEDQFDAFMGIVALEFDAHTMYSGPKDRSFSEMLNKRFFGVGIELTLKDDEYYVGRLMPGGQAYMSGLVKENDWIMAIGDAKGEMQPVSGRPNNEVVGMIRGDKGTSVKMQLQQPGEQARTVLIKRDEIVDKENKAKSAVIQKNGKRYGLIRLNDFYMDAGGDRNKGCAVDVYKELVRLRGEECEGIIMDLRSNGGGSLDEVVRMCGNFMSGRTISWLRGRSAINSYGYPGESAYYQGPLVVMVDELSASASEIFAAAMQDYGRGLIVGTETTFGKGTAQQSLNIGKMGDKEKGTEDIRYGAVRVTMEKFYRTSGAATQLKGVASDIVLQKRMYYQFPMEKDHKAVMAYDSVGVTPFNHLPSYWNYPVVIEKAKARIAANPAYGGVEKATDNLKAIMEQPVALDLSSFKQHHQQWYGNVKTITQLRELPTNKRLQVTLTTDTYIKPELRNDADNIRMNKDWLEKLSKDLYLSETISILEDMIANPVVKQAEAKQ